MSNRVAGEGLAERDLREVLSREDPDVPEKQTAAAWLPDRVTISSLREAAAGCKGCGLWASATQTVFGEGRRHAPLMLVGETPGNDEDLAGRPFVGPAGRLLDRGLADAGIDRDAAYVTNVVKHFKWEPRGKRRLHRRPDAGEIGACLPWLQAEIACIQPRVLVWPRRDGRAGIAGPRLPRDAAAR